MKQPYFVPVALAFGGNVGQVDDNFAMAVAALAPSGLTNIRISGYYRTAPVNCPPGSPDFLNAALTALCPLAPLELLHLCQSIEQTAGRPAEHGFNTPRPLDIDLILYGDLIYRDEELTLPHPRAAIRRFVLEPLAEIAPDWKFPDSNRTVSDLLAALP